MTKDCFVKIEETLCWRCQNCTRCSWADGIPVKGWEATPTIVRDCEGDFSSYIVTKCPLFKEDTKKEVTIKDMARILGKTHGTIMNTLRLSVGVIILRGWLKEKGYKLYVFNIPCKGGGIRRRFVIDKKPSK